MVRIFFKGNLDICGLLSLKDESSQSRIAVIEIVTDKY